VAYSLKCNEIKLEREVVLMKKRERPIQRGQQIPYRMLVNGGVVEKRKLGGAFEGGVCTRKILGPLHTRRTTAPERGTFLCPRGRAAFTKKGTPRYEGEVVF